MTRFIKVADTEGACDFIDLDKVSKVSCSVTRHKSGGGFSIESLAESTVPRTSPPRETVTAVISLTTAGGVGEIRFGDLDEATRWAKDNLGIDVPFSQL